MSSLYSSAQTAPRDAAQISGMFGSSAQKNLLNVAHLKSALQFQDYSQLLPADADSSRSPIIQLNFKKKHVDGGSMVQLEKMGQEKSRRSTLKMLADTDTSSIQHTLKKMDRIRERLNAAHIRISKRNQYNLY